MKLIRWGILGCGRIARKFAADLMYVEDAKLVAVGARRLETAKEFAREFPVAHIHGSYNELVKNPEVDVVYIATPHTMHHEHSILCLSHKKAVLCEKPFAINRRQAKEMIDTARANNVFLMEAMWSKFLPQFKKVQELVGNGELGEINSMLINFGFVPLPPFPPRLFDPALGGGSLMDIGVYNVFFALAVLGRPDTIEASMKPSKEGIDEQIAILFKYNSGNMAQLFCSLISNLGTEADICGSRNRLRLTSRFYGPSANIEIHGGREDDVRKVSVPKEAGFGYQFEARHVCECLRNGMMESNIVSHSDTMLLMETLDRIRASARLHYAAD